MYSIDWSNIFPRKRAKPVDQSAVADGSSPRRKSFISIPAVSRTVWALGFTSLLTDISSEMIASILPLYLVLQLGLSPLAFGVVDGIYQGFAALVRVLSGVVSDRWKKYKATAQLGYGLSAVCRILILACGSGWGAIASIIAIDRVGKGIRTAPRDAMIAQSTPKSQLATAFGVHRGLDAAGAMLGPVIAFALLYIKPDRFDLIFVASFAIGLIGVAVISLFVKQPESVVTDSKTVTKPAFTVSSLLRDRPFWSILLVGSLLGLGTISDSFIYLILQKRIGLGAMAFPLLYVGTSLVTSIFAVTFGQLADVIGRKWVFLFGYTLLAGVYSLLFLTTGGGIPLVIGAIVLMGVYYAATDGVLTAMAAAVLPAEACGTGLAVFATATNVSRILASVLFGLLWTNLGNRGAVQYYFIALIIALIAAVIFLKPVKTVPSSAHH
ncbi:MAG TPA: MFS transporter [Opitutaceae bacterium]|nr:MFS transporter [Opitutaceae bacterium]